MCIQFINMIKEHRHNKIKTKQIDKFEHLVRKHSGYHHNHYQNTGHPPNSSLTTTTNVFQPDNTTYTGETSTMTSTTTTTTTTATTASNPTTQWPLQIAITNGSSIYQPNHSDQHNHHYYPGVKILQSHHNTPQRSLHNSH